MKRILLVALSMAFILCITSCSTSQTDARASASVQAAIDSAVASALASAAVDTTTTPSTSTIAATAATATKATTTMTTTTKATTVPPAIETLEIVCDATKTMSPRETSGAILVKTSPKGADLSTVTVVSADEKVVKIVDLKTDGAVLFKLEAVAPGVSVICAQTADKTVMSALVTITVAEAAASASITTTSSTSASASTTTSMADYKAACADYTYKELARDPSKYEGLLCHVRGEVIQVLEDGLDVTLRINITKDDYYWKDTIIVAYTRKSSTESRILEDDIVDVYGAFSGMYTYKSVMGGDVTVPAISAKYVVLSE